MEPVYLSIQQEATGNRIRQLIREKGYSVRDIQEAMGFESPQAVYKWLSGKCLPNLDNFLILSKILHTSMEDILVIDGDIAVLRNEVYKRKLVWNRMARNIGAKSCSQASLAPFFAPIFLPSERKKHITV